jgi:hypothetical protein
MKYWWIFWGSMLVGALISSGLAQSGVPGP